MGITQVRLCFSTRTVPKVRICFLDELKLKPYITKGVSHTHTHQCSIYPSISVYISVYIHLIICRLYPSRSIYIHLYPYHIPPSSSHLHPAATLATLPSDHRTIGPSRGGRWHQAARTGLCAVQGVMAHGSEGDPGRNKYRITIW